MSDFVGGATNYNNELGILMQITSKVMKVSKPFILLVISVMSVFDVHFSFILLVISVFSVFWHSIRS